MQNKLNQYSIKIIPNSAIEKNLRFFIAIFLSIGEENSGEVQKRLLRNLGYQGLVIGN